MLRSCFEDTVAAPFLCEQANTGEATGEASWLPLCTQLLCNSYVEILWFLLCSWSEKNEAWLPLQSEESRSRQRKIRRHQNQAQSQSQSGDGEDERRQPRPRGQSDGRGDEIEGSRTAEPPSECAGAGRARRVGTRGRIPGPCPGESGGAPRRGASRGDTGRRSAAVVVPPPRGLRNRQSSLREQAERAEGGTAPIRQPTGPNR